MCKFVNNTKHSRTDKCMKQMIADINVYLDATKERTIVGCCCGHGRFPMTIVMRDNKQKPGQSPVWELFSKVRIPRTRNIYRKDDEGYYYIPEVMEKLGKSH